MGKIGKMKLGVQFVYYEKIFNEVLIDNIVRNISKIRRVVLHFLTRKIEEEGS